MVVREDRWANLPRPFDQKFVDETLKKHRRTGSRNHNTKLSDQDVEDIRAALEDAPRGASARLAEQYDVSISLVSKIKLGKAR